LAVPAPLTTFIASSTSLYANGASSASPKKMLTLWRLADAGLSLTITYQVLHLLIELALHCFRYGHLADWLVDNFEETH